MGPVLQFSGVNCGKISALTFALEAGEIGVLRMAAKEEKSSVIELAVGERAPDAGTISLDGAPLDAAPPGSIGWVPEGGGLISNLKAWENVTLPLWYHGKRRVAAAEETAARWLAALGVAEDAMAEFMASPPGRLSTQERKRAGLLRGLLLAPRVLVVDAALFNGLTQVAKASWPAALELLAKEGSSVLVVSVEGDTSLHWKIIG
ncbi:MAG TPA: ATP-binding cassette domain-containing protein [Gallionellaceae bacterium]